MLTWYQARAHQLFMQSAQDYFSNKYRQISTHKSAHLIALFVLLRTLHGTRAQYDDYDDYNYEEDDYDFDEDEYENEADSSYDSEDRQMGRWGGDPPNGCNTQNQEFTPDCNNENCWIRVDWTPPQRDSWMSCL